MKQTHFALLLSGVILTILVGCADKASFYPDADGDGYGDNTTSDPVWSENQPDGHVANSNDCDDSDASIHPGATEIPDDRIDQDCDSVDLKTWFRDADMDNWGDFSATMTGNVAPLGYVDLLADCDDADFRKYPGAPQRPCQGVTLHKVYLDDDGDGFGNYAVSKEIHYSDEDKNGIDLWLMLSGWVDDNTDLDDSDPNRH